MASPFKRASAVNVGVAPVVVYTVPALKVATLIDATLANILAADVKGTLQHIQGANTVNLVKGGPIPVGGAMVVVGAPRKVVMAAGDNITALCDTALGLDCSLSFLEQDA